MSVQGGGVKSCPSLTSSVPKPVDGSAGIYRGEAAPPPFPHRQRSQEHNDEQRQVRLCIEAHGFEGGQMVEDGGAEPHDEQGVEVDVGPGLGGAGGGKGEGTSRTRGAGGDKGTEGGEIWGSDMLMKLTCPLPQAPGGTGGQPSPSRCALMCIVGPPSPLPLLAPGGRAQSAAYVRPRPAVREEAKGACGGGGARRLGDNFWGTTSGERKLADDHGGPWRRLTDRAPVLMAPRRPGGPLPILSVDLPLQQYTSTVTHRREGSTSCSGASCS